MKILIACEYSGTVRDAFRRRGHDAISCDLLPTDVEGPHYQQDICDILPLHRWGLIIAHPPCTALCVSGNSTYAKGKAKHMERLQATLWTSRLWRLCLSVCDRVAFENPQGVLVTQGGLPPAQFIQPYQFGHPEQKKTGLHLHGLPQLQPTHNVYDEMMNLPKKKRERLHYLPPSAERWKLRSKTFQGIADAMADQWA